LHKRKAKRDNFKASLIHCLSEEVISIERVRKYARRARQFMMAYYLTDTGQVDQQTQDDCKKHGPVAIEKLVRNFKTHRCVVDCDYKFIMEA